MSNKLNVCVNHKYIMSNKTFSDIAAIRDFAFDKRKTDKICNDDNKWKRNNLKEC